MASRVSTTQIAESALYGISTSFARFSDAQRKINTGKQLQTPSDNPSGVAQSLNFRSRLLEITQYGRTIDQANGFLSTSESALDGVTGLIRQARTYAVQAASDNVSTETRTALANQVQNIITQLGNIGNTSYGARYVFAGQLTSNPPFQGAGDTFAYSGGTDANQNADITLDVGRGEALTINVTGDKVLTPVLDTLGKLRDDIAYGNSGAISRDDLKAIDDQLNNVLSVRADLGAKVQRLDLTKQRNELTKVNFTQFISDIEDADIPATVVEYQTAQTAYQAAVQSTARVFQTSLLDFLR